MNGKNALRTLLSKPYFILASAFMLAFLFAPHTALAFTEVFDPVDTNTTWTQTGSPYILYDFIEVEFDVTLTIEPGVVVKAEEGAEFSVAGTLNANGTEAAPIYFTSIKDDEVGGDTNGDGNSTNPASGDWVHIGFTPGANGTFTYATIRYGGFVDEGPGPDPSPFTGIYNDGATVSLSHVSIIDNGEEGLLQINGGNTTAEYLTVSDHYAHGIFVDSGTMTIDHATISDNGTGIYAESFFDIPTVTITNSEITGNTNGIIAFGANLSINNSSIYGNTLTGLRNSDSGLIDAEHNWWGDASGPTTPQNPGGTGDSITYGISGTGDGSNPDDAVDFDPWLTSNPLLEPAEPDPVIVIPGILGSWEKNGELVIDPVMHTYDDLINTFVLNGFIEGETIFPFPYEWRDTNIFTAGLLRDKINEVQTICGCEKVDIVAHSMGGLVARYYIQSGLYEDDVDQLVFIATPHLGSVNSYLTWEGGEFAPGPNSFVQKFLFSIEARREGFDNLFDYIQNRPVTSVQQLLPTFDYLREGGAGLLPYPVGYPQNTFLENLNRSITVLLDSGVDITNIVGNTDAASTISVLRVVDSPSPPKWQHGYPEFFSNPLTDRGLEYGSGDETVPLSSASFVDENVTELNANHNAVVKASQTLVYETLVGEAPTQVSNLQQDTDIFLLLHVLSPVDIQIVAPDGKRLGKNFDTGGELSEIPGAFYSGFGTDNEYAVIPNPLDGEYKVLSQGTDSGGEYTLVSGYASSNGLVEQETTSHILPGDTEEITLTVSNAFPEDLNIEDTTPVTYDILYNHIDEASDVNWITNKKFKKLLKKTAKKAEKLSGRGRGFAEKALLHVLLVELRVGHRKGKINDDGYILLKEDVEGLLGR